MVDYGGADYEHGLAGQGVWVAHHRKYVHELSEHQSEGDDHQREEGRPDLLDYRQTVLEVDVPDSQCLA